MRLERGHGAHADRSAHRGRIGARAALPLTPCCEPPSDALRLRPSRPLVRSALRYVVRSGELPSTPRSLSRDP